uniref:P53 and DNA-damage regulated 1 n=1 Tax=Cyprinus carpio carpio TaxID=630221 RepID=A0A9J7ZU42_CYPCA
MGVNGMLTQVKFCYKMAARGRLQLPVDFLAPCSSMDEGAQRILQYLTEVVAAEDILSDKQQLVDLDSRRNRNREALSALRNGSSEDLALHLDRRALDCYCCPDTHHTQTGFWKHDFCVFLVSFSYIPIYIPSCPCVLMLSHLLYYIHKHLSHIVQS